MDILKKIVERKKLRIQESKRRIPTENLRKQVEEISKNVSNYSFSEAIKRLPEESIKIIAEIKRASPVKGLLRDYDVIEMSDVYAKNEVNAISVITEEDFFLGSPQYLIDIKKRHPQIPILRKDFIFDEYQIYETKILGADALLLIASMLSTETAKNLYELAKTLGLEVLFEVHDREDLNKALLLDVPIIGINNRNLKTMEINIDNTLALKGFIPEDKIVVSES
ncbi:MAG: indole-3-glycerol phosphate synthase TrpC, partial [Thermodesulfovibrionales bacterium]|nr:indole-3-glycerol phosphate synthase TrpC [Thermodesulfovibrionales bacterium]